MKPHSITLSKPDNRRIDSRVFGEYAISVRFVKCAGMRRQSYQKIECRSSDISRRGARCTIMPSLKGDLDVDFSCDAIAAGTVIRLRITLQCPRRSFVHTGTVRWVERDSGTRVLVIGVEFTHSPRHLLKAWDRVFDRYLAAGKPVPFR